MKKNEELLQRCFDGDLNDDEMKNLFSEMSTDETLRMQFRSFQTLRQGLRSTPVHDVPVKLDERIKRLSLTSHVKMLSDKSRLQNFLSKKFSFSMPAFAATVLLLLVGSYFAATIVLAPKAETELVYIMQLPQIEVRAILN
ncbi:MAG: hypothetical protein Q8L88_11195 [Bacteroidota bacterium]|nr:hypothetical protein [Bacteroidota bacterium]